ncbi:unnamed protein product [Heligmosomoides polygyrus]|uniref:Transposase n=1 Tax=Heligmosomoides polygyrus TaxID=6339 RepID=A0A183GM56_HELPZ|nr:unnamed protein product [Heligmosomoides polygyrus]
MLLRAESRSGCYVKGRELTLFNWKYSDSAVTIDSVTRDSRTADGTVGTVEVVSTRFGTTTMNTADTLDVERRYRKKGSKRTKEAEASMEFN